MAFSLYRWLLLLKLVAVMAYAGGAVASVLARSLPERKRAVHGLASPALVLTWICGYLLAALLGISLAELWLVGGMALSFASLLALLVSLHPGRRSWSALALAALLGVLALMVLRPTWAGVR